MNTAKRGNLYMFLFIIYQLIVSTALVAAAVIAADLTGSSSGDVMASPVFLAVSQIFTFLPPIAVCMLLTRSKLSELVPFKKPEWRSAVTVALLAVLAQPFMMLLSFASSLLFPNVIGELMAGMSAYPFPVMLTAVALVPTLCEEATFRGVLLSGYRDVDIKKAAFVNGLFFGIIHMSPQQFLYAFVLGAAFAYIVYRTGSVFYSMLAHFVINGMQTVLMYLPVSEEQTAAARPTDLQLPAALLVMCAVCLPLTVVLVKAFNRRNPGDGDIKQAVAPERKQAVFNWAFCSVIIFYAVIVAGTGLTS